MGVHYPILMSTPIAHQLTRDQLNFIMKAGDLGIWQLDYNSGVLTCSDSCKANFGVPPEAIFTYRDLEAMIIPADRGRWGQTVADAIRDHTVFECEYRVTTPKGELRWIHAKGEIVYDSKGVAQHSSGFTQNITDRKKADDILTSIADGLATVDRQWHITYLNKRAHEILAPLESSSNHLIGAKLWDLPDVTGTVIEENYRRAMRDKTIVDFETYYAPLDLPLFIRAYPSDSGLSIYFMDITECKKAQASPQGAPACEEGTGI